MTCYTLLVTCLMFNSLDICPSASQKTELSPYFQLAPMYKWMLLHLMTGLSPESQEIHGTPNRCISGFGTCMKKAKEWPEKSQINASCYLYLTFSLTSFTSVLVKRGVWRLQKRTCHKVFGDCGPQVCRSDMLHAAISMALDNPMSSSRCTTACGNSSTATV